MRITRADAELDAKIDKLERQQQGDKPPPEDPDQRKGCLIAIGLFLLTAGFIAFSIWSY